MNLFDGRLQKSEIVILDQDFYDEVLYDIEESIYHSLNHLISTTNRIIRDENNLILGTFRVKVTYTPE